MLLAGIWSRWKNPGDSNQVIESCAIITCKACSAVEPLHDRMPVLINKEVADLWLHGDMEDAKALMVVYSDSLHLTPANPKMNSGAVEGPECLQAADQRERNQA